MFWAIEATAELYLGGYCAIFSFTNQQAKASRPSLSNQLDACAVGEHRSAGMNGRTVFTFTSGSSARFIWGIGIALGRRFVGMHSSSGMTRRLETKNIVLSLTRSLSRRALPPGI